MIARREIPLCHYRYDPLDQLISCAMSAQANTQRFYLKDRLANEVQGAVQRSIMQHGDQLLAEQRCEGGPLETTILATDQQRSVLTTLDSTRPHTLAYTPYGHRIPENGLLSLLGFSGERPDPVTGCYLLGNGYRAFNPVLMRFNSPDSWSPFGDGGLNAYTYCVGDPINREDKTGHVPNWFSKIQALVTRGNGFKRLSSTSLDSARSMVSTKSALASGSATPHATAGTLLPGLDPSSTSRNATTTASNSTPSASGVWDVKNTLYDANFAIESAQLKKYSGSKLKPLKKAAKKLEHYDNNKERLLSKLKNRQENLIEYGLVKPENLPTPQQLALEKIDEQRKSVIFLTDELNKKLRGT